MMLPMKILSISGILSGILGIASATAADTWLSGRVSLFGDFAGLQYSLNPGIAWGIRLPTGIQEIMIILALLAVLYMARKVEEPLNKASFGMILGGGTANIIDRLLDGYVTDYFQVGTFPIFNVADSFVTVGVAILLFDALRDEWLNRCRISA